MMRGTIYILTITSDPEAPPLITRYVRTYQVETEGHFRQYALGEAQNQALEFGPIARPWSLIHGMYRRSRHAAEGAV